MVAPMFLNSLSYWVKWWLKKLEGLNFSFMVSFISDNFSTISHFLFLENPMIFVELTWIDFGIWDMCSIGLKLYQDWFFFFFNNHLKLHISKNSSKLEKWVTLLKREGKKQIQITSHLHRKFTMKKKPNNNLTESAQI